MWILYRHRGGLCTCTDVDYVQAPMWIMYRHRGGFCTGTEVDYVQAPSLILHLVNVYTVTLLEDKHAHMTDMKL